MFFGWTTCLTYETGTRMLGYDYFSSLIDEMAENGMRRLVIMMENPHVPPVDPYNHGIAWPARNVRLKPFIDGKAVNGNPRTEFIGKIIKKAHDRGIEVIFEIKYLGYLGIQRSYPGIVFRGEVKICPDLCCDNDDAHEYVKDKTIDLLECYPEVDGVLLEHPSFDGVCHCAASEQKNIATFGKKGGELAEGIILERQAERISWCVSDLVGLSKSINPALKFGMASGFMPDDWDLHKYSRNRAHNIENLRKIKGLDFLAPYGEGRHREKETFALERIIDYLQPFDIYIHLVIRKKSPQGYPLPEASPEYIRKMIQWAREFGSQNPRLKGLLFFNEVNVPDENRTAVYKNIILQT